MSGRVSSYNLRDIWFISLHLWYIRGNVVTVVKHRPQKHASTQTNKFYQFKGSEFFLMWCRWHFRTSVTNVLWLIFLLPLCALLTQIFLQWGSATLVLKHMGIPPFFPYGNIRVSQPLHTPLSLLWPETESGSYHPSTWHVCNASSVTCMWLLVSSWPHSVYSLYI